MTENGFVEYKKYYEERFRMNELQNEHILTELREIRKDLVDVKLTAKQHSAYWAAFWGGVLLSVNLLAPVIMGGCNAG